MGRGNNKAKRIRKDRFMKEIAPLIECDVSSHFVRLKIFNQICEYYPGAERLCILGDIPQRNKWLDLTIEDFAKQFNIEFKYIPEKIRSLTKSKSLF
jgi:hypothetical protein